jgi:nucleolin
LKDFFNIDEQNISIKLPKYQDTGRCLGYGHVHFTNKDEYEAALKKDGEHIGTRYVNIRPAKGQKEVEPHSGNIPVGCKRIFVKNLPYTIT